MSCQDVCIYAGDYDGPEFSDQVRRRAAKEHRCEECRGVIRVGEQYEYLAGKWDGEFRTFKTCLVCVEIRDVFYCGGSTIGELRNDLSEQVFPTWNEVSAIDCLARLKTDAAIARMREWFASWSDGGWPAWMPGNPKAAGPQS